MACSAFFDLEGLVQINPDEASLKETYCARPGTIASESWQAHYRERRRVEHVDKELIAHGGHGGSFSSCIFF